MTGFESFQVSAWLDGVLTKQPKLSQRITSRPLRKSAWQTVVAATLFASVAVTAETNVSVLSTTSTLRVNASVGAESASVSNDEVPIGYWPKLLQEMKGWGNLEENSSEPPDPII